MGDQETKTVEADAYELNLDEGDSADVEEAMKSALDAVEKRQRERPDGDSDEASGSDSKDGDAPQTAKSQSEDSQEASALKERLLRTLADFDNFRKRTEREKETLRRFAVSEVIKDVLGVVDNLERAMASSGSIEELKQGLEMILRQQNEVMRRFGVEPIDAVDQPFDPTVHEAVAREDSSEIDSPKVVRELQRGYMIHDRLLRPSMVHVAMPVRPSKTKATKDGDSEDQGAASE